VDRRRVRGGSGGDVGGTIVGVSGLLCEPPDAERSAAGRSIWAAAEPRAKIRRDALGGAAGLEELLAKLGLRSRTGSLTNTLERLTEQGLIELTIPDKPRRKYQKRRLTEKRRRLGGWDRLSRQAMCLALFPRWRGR
jgi:hypothetical protein